MFLTYLLIGIIILIVIYFCLYYNRQYILDTFMFHPIPSSGYSEYFRTYLDKINNKKQKIEQFFITIKKNTEDEKDIKLNCLYSKCKNSKSPNSKKLLIYSHGNAGNIENRSDIISELSRYTNVLAYDYRGFGQSTSIVPTEKGVYMDIINVWNYCIDKNGLGYDSKDIILYGESLGCAISSYLFNYLVKHDYEIPDSIVLCSGFSSIKQEIYDIFTKIGGGWLGKLVSSLIDQTNFTTFDNMAEGNQLLILRGELPIRTSVLHSYGDEVIPYSHSLKNSYLINSELFTICGGHCSPRFGDVLKKIFGMEMERNEN
jgi:hypothetical protein